MSMEELLDKLEKEVEQRNAAIDKHKKETESILLQANAIPEPKQQPEPKTQTQTQTQQLPQPPSPKLKFTSKTTHLKSQEEADYQKRIQQMAAQLAKTGADPEVLKNLGPDAESTYLRARNENLEKVIKQLQLDYNALAEGQLGQKEALAEATATKERQIKQIAQLNTKLLHQQQQSESLNNQVLQLQSQLEELGNKTEQATRVAQNGVSAAQTKEKQIQRLVDQVETYKKQLNEALQREKDLLEKEEKTGGQQQIELKKKEREREELIGIVKKQQQLIDVLQRQKLHLQGAIQLGFTEEDFQKVLEK